MLFKAPLRKERIELLSAYIVLHCVIPLQAHQPPTASVGKSPSVISAIVQEAVLQTVGRSVEFDAPLMEAGLDSLGAVEVRNLLQAHAALGVVLPSTLVFDHPSQRQLVLLLSPAARASGSSATVPEAAACRDVGGVCVVGKGILLPSGIDSKDAAWRMSASGSELFRLVPHTRWDTYAAADLFPIEVTQCMQYGSFVNGIQHFDSGLFGISPAESRSMDPQQRLLLEVGYMALHGSSLVRSSVAGTHSGVFVGIAAVDFQTEFLKTSHVNVYAAVVSRSHSIASGRISFTLDFHGPCVSYDTACSASLVACQAAQDALGWAETPCSLLAGVALVLAPHVSASYAMSRISTKLGKSFTFDRRADGFARAEVRTLSTPPADQPPHLLNVQ